MKLPQDKKKRMQILVLAVVFGLAGIYGVFQFVVSPLLKTHAECKMEIAELKKKIEAADKETKKLSGLRQESASLRSQLREIDEKYVLKSEFKKLRNFDIAAKELIRRAATNANVKLDVLGAVGETPLGKGGAFRSYVMQVNASAGVDSPTDGYSCLTNFIMAFETSSPYVTVSSVQLAPGDRRGSVKVLFNVGWPVWEDPDIVAKFAERPEDTAGNGKQAPENAEDKGT